jgi:alpha-1,6-mannosyltransferase
MIDKRAISIASLGLMGSPIYALNFRLHEILLKRGLMGPGTGLFTFFLYHYVPLGILYLIGVGIVFRSGRHKAMAPHILYIILFFGFMYRLLLVPSQPMLSWDMYRYIWDGRVQAHAINPYRYPPNHEAIEQLRDGAIYPYINRKGSPTIYPAGAQVLFYLLNRLGARSVAAFKGAILLFDMGSILLLVLLLANLGLNRERVLVYAWNPLIIYELANNGHLDGFVVFFILLSLCFLIKERPNASVSSLAVATSLKLYPFIILPAILREKKVRRLLLFSVIFFLFYLPYLSVGKKVLGFLPEYFTNPNESFNLGLKVYLLKLFPALNQWFATKAFAVALIVAAGAVWTKRKKDAVDAIKLAYIMAGLQIVLTSVSLHPWYVLWIIPFLSLFPSPAWIYFSIVVPFSYLEYEPSQGILPEWVRHMEYIPFFILLAMEYSVFQRFPKALFPWRLPGEKESMRTE